MINCRISWMFVCCAFYILFRGLLEHAVPSHSECTIFPIYLASDFPDSNVPVEKNLTINGKTEEEYVAIAIIPFNITHVHEEPNYSPKLSPVGANTHELFKEIKTQATTTQLTNVGRFEVYYDMYTSSLCNSYNTTTSFMHTKSCHLFYIKNGPVIGHYDMLISICHYFLYYYGHLFMDAIGPLMMMPQYLRDNAYVVINQNMPVMAEAFTVIGFPPERQVHLHGNMFAHAKLLYTMKPGACLEFIGESLHQVRNYFHRKYHLENIKSTRYVLYNRKERIRNLFNFEKIFDAINKNFPSLHWERNEEQTDLQSTVLYYASIKYLFSVSGSGLANIIFMHKGSSVSEIMMAESNICMSFCSEIAGLYHNFAYLPGRNHFDQSPFQVNVGLVISLVSKGLKPLNVV